MKSKDYERGVLDSVHRRLDLAKKKRSDYATSEDVLANFKRLGEAVRALGIHKLWETRPALAYALFMSVMKIDRMTNLLRQGKTPTNEALQDSWDDAKNYLDLAEAIYIEERDRAIIIPAHSAVPGTAEKYAGSLRPLLRRSKQKA